LNLSGYTVFTEAASGNFAVTPISALLAGAEKVYAVARDSRYGSVEEVSAHLLQLARKAGVEKRLAITRDFSDLGKADIITNLGFLRPIDASKISLLKPHAVIPLMWETWEFREADLDLRACFERDILVLGTDEHHPDLQIFRYVGGIAAKLLYELQLEVFRSRIVLVGGGEFGKSVAETLLKMGSNVEQVSSLAEKNMPAECRWLGSSLSDAVSSLEKADAIVFAEHIREDQLLGEQANMSVERLLEINRDIKIAHISGLIDADALIAAGVEFKPESPAKQARTMSVTTGYVGPRPIVELHTAGLKVGEEMARARVSTASFAAAKEAALQYPLCQDFPDHILHKHQPGAEK